MSIGISAATLLFLPAAAATACPPDWTPSPTTPRGARAATSCLPSAPPRSSAAWSSARSMGAHLPASARRRRIATSRQGSPRRRACGSGSTRTRRGSALPRGGAAAWRVTLPALPTGARGQPDDYHGYQQDCAWVDAGTGQWRALACDGGVRFDPLPWRIAELSCLCAHGSAASAAFADDRQALEATSGYNQRLLTRRTAISFSIAAALALLPTLLLLGRTGWRRLRRGANAEPGAGVQGAATSPSQSATRAALTTPSGAASSAAAKGKLRAARASAAGRRLRVSFAMGQAGWALS